MREEKRLEDATRQVAPVRHENLVSFVMVSSGRADPDLIELEALAQSVSGAFDFFEILYVAGARIAEESFLERQRLSAIPNIRCIFLQVDAGFEDLLHQGLAAAIGDIVVAFQPGEIPIKGVTQLVAVCATENRDVVRAVRPARANGFLSRALMRLIVRMLHLLIGRRVEPFNCRAICVSRSALARIVENQSSLRLFRLVSMPDQFREGSVLFEVRSQRRSLSHSWYRARLVAQLVALGTQQLLTSMALITLTFGVISILFGIYAVVISLVRDVAEGWLSTSLILSFVATAVFCVLSVLCLGVAQVMRVANSGNVLASQEFSSADLFTRAKALNVEFDEGVG